MKQDLVQHQQIAVAAAEEQCRLQQLLNESVGRVEAAEAQVNLQSGVGAAGRPVTFEQVVLMQQEILAAEEAQVGELLIILATACNAVRQASKLDAALGEVRRRSLAGAESAAVLQQLQVHAAYDSRLWCIAHDTRAGRS